MTVPEDIRKVDRPPNTVVCDNGGDGPRRYAVRERKGVKYVPGGNPLPKNGNVIGHIAGGRFVPVGEETAPTGPDMLSYGAAALVGSVSKDLLDDLLSAYPVDTAFQIISIASLRVIRPGITNSRISTHYKRTFVSVFYSGVHLSKNTVGDLLQRLGMDGKKRARFYELRMNSVSKEHHIAIDGMLKHNNSEVNDLSAFSYKSRTVGSKEISVIYAYDIETSEPICAEVFPGNCIDASCYKAFIRNNDIRKGIIVADKGFPPSMIKDELDDRPDLHFLTPVKRNDIRISNNNMTEFEGTLEGTGAHILYKKKNIGGGRSLYAFRDTGKAFAEENTFLTKAGKNKNFNMEEYEKKDKTFGLIVFESDLDLPSETVYKCYADRWMLELVFNRYKNDECLDNTRVQGDFSVIGSEFVNFISTVMTCRILDKMKMSGLLKEMTYGDIMDDLSSAWRYADAPMPPSSGDGRWVHTNKTVLEELEALRLSIPVTKPEPKKRGRPKGPPKPEKPKRPRGRPKKGSMLL
jgi:hypothetical protein